MRNYVKVEDLNISIHTLRMEGDVNIRGSSKSAQIFQSTPSAWRVTSLPFNFLLAYTFQSTPSAWRVTMGDLGKFQAAVISIHTLRMEGDPVI